MTGFRLHHGGAGRSSTEDEADVEAKAAVFDMDGLLIDSEPLWRLAEQKVFGALGLELTDADCETTMGMRIDAVVQHWWQRAPWSGASLEEVERDILCEVERLIAERGESLPGVDHALELFAGEGYRLGLASSSPRRLIDAVLARLDLEGCFDVVCSAVEEEHGKPHPAVYLTAARALGVSPSRCVALEDSVSGLRAAQAAGMRTIVVPESTPGAESPLREADCLLASLLELDASVHRLLT